jgi:hypothetical protein
MKIRSAGSQFFISTDRNDNPNMLTGAMFPTFRTEEEGGGGPKSEKVRLTSEILASAHLKMTAGCKQL